MKWLSAPPPQDWLRCHVLVDGQPVLDGHNSTTVDRTGRIELAKALTPTNYSSAIISPNRMRRRLQDRRRHVRSRSFRLVFNQGSSRTGRDSQAQRRHHDQRRHPYAEADSAGQAAKTSADVQRLRWHQCVGQISRYHRRRRRGRSLKKNAAAGPANSLLQISPGDTIAVSYDDHNRLHEDSKVLTSELNSSYYNGKITLAEEIIRGEGEPAPHRISRCQAAARRRSVVGHRFRLRRRHHRGPGHGARHGYDLQWREARHQLAGNWINGSKNRTTTPASYRGAQDRRQDREEHHQSSTWRSDHRQLSR